jgi:predicted DNA-binding transcriptional regulator AlpA
MEMYIKRSGLTNRQLAKDMGCSESTLYDKMNNKREFRQSEIKFIANHLNLSDKERNEVFFN